MANYAVLKAAINAVIKTNGNKEITGQVLNQTLMAIVDSLGENYQFAGVAVPSTNPGTPDQNIFYLATQAGTYTNFGATVLPAGISMLEWKNNTWSSETFFTIDDAPTAGSDHLVKSGGVKTAIDNVAFSTNEKVKDVGIDSTPTSGSDNLIKSGAVFDAFKNDGGAYDVSVHFPTGGVEGGNTYTLDGAIAMVPQNMRKGGMSIKFVSSSDNKYVEYFLTKNTWSASEADWEKVNLEEEVSKLGQKVELLSKTSISSEGTNGYYIDQTGNVYENNLFCYVSIPLNRGDYLVVNARGFNRNVSIISKEIISGSSYSPLVLDNGVDEVAKYSYLVTEDGTYAVCYRIQYGCTISKYYDEQINTILDLGRKVIDNYAPIMDISGFIDTVGIAHDNDSNWKRTDYISVNGGEFISYNARAFNAVSIVSFYDNSKNYISGVIPEGNNYTIVTGRIQVPANAMYVIFCTHSDILHEPYFYRDNAPLLNKIQRIKKSSESIDLYPLINIPGWINDDGITISGDGTDQNWLHSDFIPFIANKKVNFNLRGYNTVCSLAFYDATFGVLETYIYSGSSVGDYIGTATSPNGTKYIRLCTGRYETPNKYVILEMTNDELYKMLGTYKSNGEQPTLQVLMPYAIYDVCNDIPNATGGGRNRNNSAAIYLDHSLKGLTSEKDIHFKDGNDKKVFVAPIQVSGSNETAPQTTFNGGNNINEANESIIVTGEIEESTHIVKHRSTLNSVTENAHPFVLCIGDSITYGEQATWRVDNYSSNNAYHLICKQLFMKDAIDNNNRGYECTFLGHYLKSNTFEYGGNTYNVVTHHEGIRGISMAAHLNGLVPEFWDSVNNKWSINAWLSKYRTLDDSGNRLALGEGTGTLITADNLNSIDVCTPTHIIIALSMNGGATKAQYEEMIGIIKDEIPSAKIAIAIPDCEGTYFPSLHPNYIDCEYWKTSQWNIETFHTQQYNVQSMVQTYFASLENESNDIYVLPFYFTSPSAESVSNRVADMADGREVNVAYGWSPYVHTNAVGHHNWGYQLYSWLKYTIAKDVE